MPPIIKKEKTLQILSKAREEAESAGTVKKTRKTVSTDTCLIRGGVLAAYTGDAVNIVVSEGVKEIPEKVLPISKNTKSVHLPESLKKLGEISFPKGCQVNLPSAYLRTQNHFLGNIPADFWKVCGRTARRTRII